MNSISENIETVSIQEDLVASESSLQYSSTSILPGTYLKILYYVESILPNLLKQNTVWHAVDVDYHPPRVERVWRQFGDYRIYLHVIHEASIDEVLYHPHPWPAAIRVIESNYTMAVGYGDPHKTPPKHAVTIALAENSAYEMINPKGWHFVCPQKGPVMTLMIAGKPWPGCDTKSNLCLNPLSQKRKKEIMQWIMNKMNKKIL